MTDRYYALTVVLEKDMRDDDAECVIEAIRMIKHVKNVKPLIANPHTWMAEERARNEIAKKLWAVLHEKD